jgi:hypothetical protein
MYLAARENESVVVEIQTLPRNPRL